MSFLQTGGIRRLRAESVLYLQEYDLETDPKTLADAIQLAHHGDRFVFVMTGKGGAGDFALSSRAFREKFPRCSCPDCQLPEEP